LLSRASHKSPDMVVDTTLLCIQMNFYANSQP
jgi:hypothetical protein